MAPKGEENMSASESQRAAWLGPEFWEQLDRLDIQHKRAQSQYQDAQRCLERLTPPEAEELRQAWRRYCEVIADLDRATAEFETLRAWAG
ncbi:MAG: hypothetical protein PVS2B3_17400 [Steroidobacteraceae bacterium]